MGIWNDIRSSVPRLMNRKSSSKRPSESDANAALKVQPATAFVSDVCKVTDAVKYNGAQKLDEYFPDPHRREKVARVLTNLGKFAVESALNESLKGVTGGVQVYKIVKEGLKDQPNSHPTNRIKKQDLMITMEEMQAKMEKMQEEVNILKQQNQAAEYSIELDPFKECSDEPIRSSASMESDRKKVFIRSRL